ncbi:MarR family winged helix-turn-helix transcriptional regulator [Streptomyces flaveolus]|uniref:MarR family winged helix-turn-helix transcriptional regulator n=1 Tax=Streptomyces flaveolus TaxID=67297 RepID=UPI00380729E8
MPEYADEPMQDLLQAVTMLSYALSRSQVHEQLTVGLDTKVERAGFAVLRTLLQADAPLRSSTLAERLMVQPPHVTRQVARLEQQGLVERGRDTDDHRAQLVGLTDHGRKIARQLSQAMHDRMKHTLEGFSDADIRAAARIVERMATANSSRDA